VYVPGLVYVNEGLSVTEFVIPCPKYHKKLVPGVTLLKLTFNGGQPEIVFVVIVATVVCNLKSILNTPLLQLLERFGVAQTLVVGQGQAPGVTGKS
jgi:hypothetical protein